ncbi:c-type cytochrome [Rudanella lutea]|uniref:c-type cytochrome n=1 Tax=Rudanella lutea TaxID=451374 RepID=UPI0003639CE2|nr:cytochrome c [Rudanella lutea]
MKRSITTALLALTFGWYGCSDGAQQRAQEAPTDPAETVAQEEVHGSEVKTISLTNPLDGAMITSGKSIYDVKCGSCHKLDETKLVGPGWKDVTKRRKPEWIMNMILNVDMMLEKDPEAQKMLEQCLVRMPNQNLSEADARAVLEFMRSNDGEK